MARRNSAVCDNDGCNNTTRQRRDKYTTYLKYCNRCDNYRAKYGINGPIADQLLEDQGGCCAACGSSIEFGLGGHVGIHNAVVDHCHVSGKVRGILCGRCNVVLGKAKDSPRVLDSCAEYLRRSGDYE